MVFGAPKGIILTSFSELGLSEKIVASVTQLGYTTPTPIQAKAIPLLLEGRDLMRAAARGNWVGSLAVQSPGDMEGLPTRAALTADEHR